MSKRKPLIFQKSCLAMAVVALSACSTNPVQDDSAIGAVSDTLSRAGMKTRDISVSAWDKAIYLLGFSDVNPDDSSRAEKANNQLLDEVDLALLEEDAVLAPDFFSPSNDIVVVTASDGLQTPTASPAPFQTPTKATVTLEASSPAVTDQDSDGVLDDIASASIDDATFIIPEAESEGATDSLEADSQYFHEVASAQTLWDIAKSTTGDANNWHTIADVNDLIQSTSVYPGQRLLIPSDLVKPELLSTTAESGFKTPTDSAATTAVSTEIMGVSDSEEALAAGEQRLPIPVTDNTTTMPNEAAEIVGVSDDTVKIELGEGESLWEFARRTTGDATNWEGIAAHNGMDENAARLVFPGQMIAVPSTMLRTDGSTSEAPKAASKLVDDASVEVASADDLTILVEPDSEETSEESALRIVQAAYQVEPLVVPEAADSEDSRANSATAAQNRELEEVIVSGTYYPKAVYHETNFSSPLLMRVSPGTRLQVSQIDGPWLKVETELGTGYLHQRDSR